MIAPAGKSMEGEQRAITIRSAQAGDQPAIRQLVREAGVNPTGIHWSRFVVACDPAGSVIGCGQVKTHGDGSRELASIVVSHSWQRQGIAAAIITTLQQRQNQALWLTCMDRLIPFYQKYGFDRITAIDAMPAYFRRASRFFNLYLALSRGKGRLAVMVWQPTVSGKLDRKGEAEI